MFRKASGFFSKIFESNTAIKITSILLATIIWAAVSINVYPTIETGPLYNVPVKIALEGSYAEANQLDVVSSSEQYVTVKLSGMRKEIGDLKSDDLVAEIDVSGVLVPREYRLTPEIKSLSGKKFDVISTEPSSISVTFDRIITKEFPVEPLVDNMKIAQGYMSGDLTVSPETVSVTGPQDMINSISRVCAKVTLEKELDSAHQFNTPDLVLYSSSGAIIADEDKRLSFDKNSFAVEIPVYVRQTLPLEVNIINAPENFDMNFFRSQLVFSVPELDIAAPNDKIKELASLNIGTINMREVDAGSVFEFKAENFLPEAYENLTQIESVTVTCPTEGIGKKAIAIKGKDIQFVNRPAQFDFESISSGMTLFVVGDEEQIASISKEDITAQIDLFDFDMQEGTHKMSVEFIISASSYNKVWFIGGEGMATPKIIVTASLVPPEE